MAERFKRGASMKHFAILCLMVAAGLLCAAESDPTYLDPTSAGADYAAQGEYKNDWGGSQVIALGDGNFRMVTYPGGLPGDGWQKETKTEVPGKTRGNRHCFQG